MLKKKLIAKLLNCIIEIEEKQQFYIYVNSE